MYLQLSAKEAKDQVESNRTDLLPAQNRESFW